MQVREIAQAQKVEKNGAAEAQIKTLSLICVLSS